MGKLLLGGQEDVQTLCDDGFLRIEEAEGDLEVGDCCARIDVGRWDGGAMPVVRVGVWLVVVAVGGRHRGGGSRFVDKG